MLKGIVEFLDFTFGTVPLGTAGYGVERLRHMRFTGAPIRFIDRIGQWAGGHWQEGALQARKAVAIGKIANFVDMLRSMDLPITEENLVSALGTFGLDVPEALQVLEVVREKELAQIVPTEVACA